MLDRPPSDGKQPALGTVNKMYRVYQQGWEVANKAAGNAADHFWHTGKTIVQHDKEGVMGHKLVGSVCRCRGRLGHTSSPTEPPESPVQKERSLGEASAPWDLSFSMGFLKFLGLEAMEVGLGAREVLSRYAA